MLYGKGHSKRVKIHEEKGRRDGKRSEKVGLGAMSSASTEQAVLFLKNENNNRIL